jgi:hypothetical protein
MKLYENTHGFLRLHDGITLTRVQGNETMTLEGERIVYAEMIGVGDVAYWKFTLSPDAYVEYTYPAWEQGYDELASRFSDEEKGKELHFLTIARGEHGLQHVLDGDSPGHVHIGHNDGMHIERFETSVEWEHGSDRFKLILFSPKERRRIAICLDRRDWVAAFASLFAQFDYKDWHMELRKEEQRD